MNKKDKKTSWGHVAAWYSDMLEQGDDTYQEKVIKPNLLRIAGEGKGKKLADIACGSGYFSRAFTERGFSVYGADVGSELINEAKKLSDKVEYIVAPADKLSYEDNSFDVASIVLAIQNIENVKGTFQEAARIMKKDGSLFLVLNHPSFRIPKMSSWGYDEKEEKQYRRIDAYLSESKTEIDMNPGKKSGKQMTVSFHRPLQYYTKLLANSGFLIKRIEEWESHKKSEPGKRSVEENRIRREIPMFLFIEAVKI